MTEIPIERPIHDKCYWSSWHNNFVIYEPAPRGYRTCQEDHGLAGDLETILHRTVYAAAMGPIGGIETAAQIINYVNVFNQGEEQDG